MSVDAQRRKSIACSGEAPYGRERLDRCLRRLCSCPFLPASAPHTVKNRRWPKIGTSVGQQYAAQAGYPVICIPVGLDNNGMPVSLSLQHTAWQEAELVKWASAIEDLWNRESGWRALSMFRNLHSKNIPVDKICPSGDAGTGADAVPPTNMRPRQSSIAPSATTKCLAKL